MCFTPHYASTYAVYAQTQTTRNYVKIANLRAGQRTCVGMERNKRYYVTYIRDAGSFSDYIVQGPYQRK